MGGQLVLGRGRQLLRAPLGFLASRPGLFVVLAFLIAVQNTYAVSLLQAETLAQVARP